MGTKREMRNYFKGLFDDYWEIALWSIVLMSIGFVAGIAVTSYIYRDTIINSFHP